MFLCIWVLVLNPKPQKHLSLFGIRLVSRPRGGLSNLATNVAISIKNGGSHLPKKHVLRFVLRKGGGGAAIIDQGDGVGPGSAARSIGRTSTWESN